METKEVKDILIKREKDYLKTETFSQQPGIYAFFFIGEEFPIIGSLVKKHQIIYIGKTESSQDKRNSKTHFTTGKTGSSTVRKSIGSLLCSSKNLKPIPRNESDYKKGKFSHFKFDVLSEEIITEWMKENLALSFYEYSENSQEIEDLETKLIEELIPILNIAKNPKNTFKKQLQQLRKNCSLIASKGYSINDAPKDKPIVNTKQKGVLKMKSSGKYIDLWMKNRASITKKLKDAYAIQIIQMSAENFNNIGNRKSYSFNLEFKGGVVSNNIGGSAVARDLAYVLENSEEVRELIKSGHYKINMDKNFLLEIKRL